LAFEDQILDEIQAINLMDDMRHETRQRPQRAYRVFVSGVA
jgi:hypothetical protein